MRSKPYVVSTLAVFSLFLAANYYSYLRMAQRSCADCFITFGFPFELWGEGGFVTVRTILWSGLIANISIAVWASILLGWAFKRVLSRRSIVRGRDSVNDAT
jgi:hypothetical protein